MGQRLTDGEIERIPLIGILAVSDTGVHRGLKIRSCDVTGILPPKHVSEVHAELQERIDEGKVTDGKQHGWIEHDGETVTSYSIDDRLLPDAQSPVQIPGDSTTGRGDTSPASAAD